MKINQFYVANCVDFMADMKPGSVDLTVTSPPYDGLRDYQGYKFDFEAVATGLWRVTKPGGVVVWVVGDQTKNGSESGTSFRQALYFMEIGFNLFDTMIYHKKNTPFPRPERYTNAFEYMFVLSKNTPKTFNPIHVDTVRSNAGYSTYNKGPKFEKTRKMVQLNKTKKRTNVWSYAVGLGGTTSDKVAFQHPAIFPEKLAYDHVISWSNPGDLVFDPMCGSGTTCKVARCAGRDYIGVDISSDYIDIAKQRLGSILL